MESIGSMLGARARFSEAVMVAGGAEMEPTRKAVWVGESGLGGGED